MALVVLFSLLFYGCSSIGKPEAEKKALDFVNSNVKFYAKENNSSSVLAKYRVESISSYEEGGNWIVLMHISSEYQNNTKKNDITLKLNGKGNVVEFNGKKVAN